MCASRSFQHLGTTAWLWLLWLALCGNGAWAESPRGDPLAVVAGVGVTRAQLDFTAPTARISTRVDAVPTAVIGLESSPEFQYGVFARLEVGLGAQLTLPGTKETLTYNLHQVRAGGYYRWSPSPGGSGWDLRLGLGLHGVVQRVQGQSPALLVDSEVAGPALEAAAEKFFNSRRASVGLLVGLEVPFFIRESPRDSGDPGRFHALGAGLTGGLRLTPTLSLSFEARLAQSTVVYRGEGTRGAGVNGGTTEDRLISALLMTRYAL